MGFDQAIYRCLARSTSCAGRARPSEFWWFALVFAAALAVAFSVLLFAPALTALAALPMLALSPAMASVTVRRLHDLGLSGWTLALMVPVLGQVLLIAWLVRPALGRPNRYGPVPAQERARTLLYAR